MIATKDVEPKKLANVEDIYPMSPMQQGILFHCLYDPGVGMYCLELGCQIEAALDVQAFRRAWGKVIQRHAVLRTRFLWEGLDKPRQVVRKSVELPWREEDWRELDQSSQREKWQRLLLDERQRGFDFREAPLLRLVLVRTGEERYYFAWNSHHILLDGWCWPTVMGEALILYAAYREGREPQLKSPRLYRDYILWLQKQDEKKAEAFWREELKGLTTPTRLGIERERKPAFAEANGEFGVVEMFLDPERSRNLDELARRQKVTASTVVQSAWAVVLGRYSGESEVVFGATVSGRSGAGGAFEATVGLFINTLPVHLQIKSGERVSAFQNRIQQRHTRGLDYEYSPLPRVQEWSQVPRGTPLFENIVVFENLPVNAAMQQWTGASLKFSDVSTVEINNYPIALVIRPSEELTLTCHYSRRLYEQQSVERLLEHFRLVLQQIVKGPDLRVEEVSLLSSAERQQLLVDWNSTEACYPKLCVHELFEQQVKRNPGLVALEYEKRQLSYQDLDWRANQLARHLKQLGISAEMVVGVAMERSMEMVVALLGVMKAGAAFMPLDPGYPEERLSFLLEDSGVPVLLTQEKFRQHFTAFSGEMLACDGQWDMIARENESSLGKVGGPGNLAYVIYTSGSTGHPKGAMNVHSGLSNRLLWMQEQYRLDETDRVLQKTPFTFDVSVWEFFWPLIAGARLVMARPGGHQDPQYLSEIIQGCRITTLHFVPPMLGVWLESAGAASCSSLRCVICSGEALNVELVRKFHKALNAELHNLYGPTEASIDVTYWHCREDFANDLVPIGRPISNTQVYVLDESWQPAPTGVAGELFLGGTGLARGYLNKPALTAEKFVPNPFSERQGDRLYRTGDRVRWLADGTLEFLGRLDYQIKLRGFRIELGEIEATLLQHSGVKQAVAVVRGEGPGKQLVAYVALRDPAGAVSTNDLREHLKERLPEYMVPSVFMVLDALPLNSNGKVDRKALPDPEYRPAKEYISPGNAREEVLCEIFAAVLKLDRVSVNQNFFEAGGHSLLATQVMARITDAMGVELPLRRLFEAPTVAELAAIIDQMTAAGITEKVPPIVSVPRDQVSPLSFAQQRLWFLDQFQPGMVAYNIPVALRLHGSVQIEVMERVFTELIRRHQSLRTTFQAVAGEARQFISLPAEFKLPLTDLSSLPLESREAEALRLAQVEARQPFDLTRGPLLRVKLVRLEEQHHVLLLTMHHIVTDGWSMGIIVREIGRLYEAYLKNEAPGLPELKVQYADYAVWQRAWLQGEVLERQIDYWRKQLAEIHPLDMPADYPRTAVENEAGAAVQWVLSEELTQKLRELSRREGATIFMTLLAAWQLLLSRYTRQSDISIGSPIAGRTRTDIEEVIGFFVNTLVLRTDLSGAPMFRDLLKRVRETTLNAFAHQDVPFEKLVEELRPERHLGRSPLFQSMFVLQNAPQMELDLPGLKLSAFDRDVETSQFELLLNAAEQNGRIVGYLSYRTSLYAAGSMRRLMGHWQNLLVSIVETPQKRISALEFLSPAERWQIVEEWNRTQAEYPQRCVHELVEQQAAKSPVAVAVEYAGKQLNYAELSQRANQLAHYLKKMGAGPEVPVGICLERSLEMTIGVLAILKTGSAYVPLDPTYPSSRLSYMLENAQIDMVLTQQQFLGIFSGLVETPVCLEAEWQNISRESPDNLNVQVDGANVAYVLYTSGSTGRPKGVALSHAAAANLIQWLLEHSSGIQAPTTLQFASLSFDVSFQDIFATWCAGGRVVLMADEERRDPSQLWQRLVEQRVTRISLPFVALQQLAEVAVRIDQNGNCLQELITAGEQLRTTPALQKLLGHMPQCMLENQYGPTETHVVTSCRLEKDPGRWDTLPPIGKPTPNTKVYLLNEEYLPVPVGAAGELYLGGMQLARGYLNRPELTAERFLPNPFSQIPGARLYQTGDLARYREDGDIEYLGRIDQQVKVRGYRVELGEVESALGECEGVEQAVVTASGDQPGEKCLVAYVVGRNGQALVESRLRSELRQRLPEFIVPAVIKVLDQFPLTPSGKIDRRRLPNLESNVDLAEEYVAPRNPTEEVLCGIWEGILKRERIGISKNFFDAGGHSLLATQVVARIADAFQVELPLRRLFEAPTVAELALIIQQRKAESNGHMEPRIVSTPRGQAIPLSFAQQRLWFLDQFQPGMSTYNISAALRLHGSLRIDIMERVFTELIRRHESLRTTFYSIEGEARQLIALPVEFKLSSSDLSSLSVESREAEALQLAQVEAREPFDLTRGPLLRVKLVRLEEQHHVLLLTMHHIVTDGWSMGIIVREIGRLYEAYLKNEEPGLPALKVQYADYAVWQRAWLQGEVLERQIDYWRKQLAGVPMLDLPTDHARGPIENLAGASLDWELSSELGVQLKTLARRQGATLFMTLLAVFQVLLSRYTRQQDIAVGSPIAGRTRTETDNVIGFFVNTLVLRAWMSATMNFRELLAQVQQKTLEAYEHQEVPFEKLVEDLRPERDLSRPPLFQVMFSFLNMPVSELELPGLKLSGLNIPSAMEKFELSLFAGEQQGRILGSLSYRTELFAESTMRRFLSHFENLVTDIVSAPQKPIGELTMLTLAERQALLECNPAHVNFPRKCIHELFEEQVKRTPRAVAAIHNESQLTYSELDHKASQLARLLCSWGLGPETLVAVCVERGLEMIVGLLGILKAGAAYVPLDPAYPSERLAYMLEDTQVPVLLTHKKLRDLLPRFAGRIVELDGAWPGPGKESSEKPVGKVSPEHLAYVIYTSGSTGRPKGTAIEHRSACTLLYWAREVFVAEDLAGILASTSLCFDMSIFEIFAPLSWGGTVIVAENALQLPQLPRADKVTLVDTVPSAITELLRIQGLPANIRTVNLGGEALMRPLVEKIYQETKVRQVINLYGPTEDTTFSTFAVLAPGDRRVVEIGRPVANTLGYVLDENMELTPAGVPGALYLAGEGLARGYLGRPDLTADRFVPNPFSKIGGERLYSVGDLVRYREDGNLEYLGRIDHQVKLRGFRVELGEIESVLLEHPRVEQAAVIVREDGRGEKHLMGYVAGKDSDAQLTLGELRNHLKSRLPEYMVPSTFVQLPRLPLTPNGKIDRKALPQATDTTMGSEKPFVQPRDLLEKELADIWEDLLGKRPIGVLENFFELGGHSILALRLSARIENQLGKRLPVVALFASPTIEMLAQHLRVQTQPGTWSPLVPLQPNGSSLPLFFVHAVGGQVFSYLDLGRHLSQDQPLYGLQSRQRRKELAQHTRLEEMASEYVDAIRAFQPVGPYMLGGWSMGGIVAFEMARQMQDQGQEVALLALVDSFAPSGDSADALSPEQRSAAELANFALDLGFSYDRILASADALLALPLDRQLAHLLSEAKASRLLPLDATQEDISEIWQVFQTNFRMMVSYQGGAYRGEVTLFPAETIFGAGAGQNGSAWNDSVWKDPQRGWGRWALGGVEVIPLQGNHFTIIREPQVKILAEQLQTRLKIAAGATPVTAAHQSQGAS